MQSLRTLLAATLVGGAMLTLPMSQAVAEPTEATRAGATIVKLSPDFLKALATLKVAPGAIAPGKLEVNSRGAKASFPITTGAVDLGTLKAEISHEGGLSLSAGKTRVELTSFIIDLAGDRPVLTGLVTVNDSLIGRVPLFDLNVSPRGVGGNEDYLKINDVGVTLTAEAADALNSIFGVTAFTGGFPIGTAYVRAILEFERH